MLLMELLLNHLGYVIKENYCIFKDRTQSVFVGGDLSCSQQVTSDVPQGSILGPLLFSLCVTDLPNSLRAANVLMYADDTVIYYAASDANQLERVVNTDFKFLYD